MPDLKSNDIEMTTLPAGLARGLAAKFPTVLSRVIPMLEPGWRIHTSEDWDGNEVIILVSPGCPDGHIERTMAGAIRDRQWKKADNA